jgi:MFS family permease
MGTAVESNSHFVIGHGDVGRHVDEITEDLARLGIAADRWGRSPILMVNVLCYSVIEFASGLSPNLTTLLILRAIFGIAMGGEWGVGGSLTMESIPPHARGFASGLLQSGYPTGYFLASIVYGLLFQYIGWRGMFMIGAEASSPGRPISARGLPRRSIGHQLRLQPYNCSAPGTDLFPLRRRTRAMIGTRRATRNPPHRTTRPPRGLGWLLDWLRSRDAQTLHRALRKLRRQKA